MHATRRVTPLRGTLDATVAVPGSKSIANRALVCALLADGITTLRNVPAGDDTVAMLRCIQLLGAAVVQGEPDPATGDSTVEITGTAGHLAAGPLVLPAELAGTTSRFLTAVAALGPGPYTVDGAAPLRARPMGPLHDALAALGAGVAPGGQAGHLPVTITGPLPSGTEAAVAMRGDVSSQFVSALMMIGPVLGGLRITLVTPLVSRPYLRMTAAVMEAFGVGGCVVADDAIVVPAGSYRGVVHAVEPDASSAGYPLAAAAICGGTVRVPGLGNASLQGDAAFARVLAEMGCLVTQDDDDTVVERTGPLQGVDIDMGSISDLVPTLAVVAPFATGPTRITGVGFIRAKESDRIGDLAAELRACGVAVEELDDGLRITPAVPVGTRVRTHHDHRLAMAFALIGLRVRGVEIEDPEVVAKSWPGFWSMLDDLG